MKRHFLIGSVAAATVIATSAFAVVASSPGSTAAGVPSSAYGLSASGALPFEPTPYVESIDGKERSASALELPAGTPIDAALVDVRAGADTASVKLADIKVGGDAFANLPELPQEARDACQDVPDASLVDLLPEGALPALPGVPTADSLPVSSLQDLCDLLLTPPDSLIGLDLLRVYCDGDQGGVEVAGLDVLGLPVDLPQIPANTTVPAAPLATLTFNKQTRNADGSFTVNGLVLDLGSGAEVITVGSATCGQPAADPTPRPRVRDPKPQLKPAPKPAPVKRNLPVTG